MRKALQILEGNHSLRVGGRWCESYFATPPRSNPAFFGLLSSLDKEVSRIRMGLAALETRAFRKELNFWRKALRMRSLTSEGFNHAHTRIKALAGKCNLTPKVGRDLRFAKKEEARLLAVQRVRKMRESGWYLQDEEGIYEALAKENLSLRHAGISRRELRQMRRRSVVADVQKALENTKPLWPHKRCLHPREVESIIRSWRIRPAELGVTKERLSTYFSTPLPSRPGVSDKLVDEILAPGCFTNGERTKTLAILESRGILTRDALVRCTEVELLSIRGFGRKKLNVLKEELARDGLHLGMCE